VPRRRQANGIIYGELVTKMVWIDLRHTLDEVRAITQHGGPRTRREWFRSGAGDRVHHESLPLPMAHRIAQGRGPDIVLTWMFSIVRIDVSNLTVLEDEQGFLRQHRDLEHPGGLHQCRKAARTDFESRIPHLKRGRVFHRLIVLCGPFRVIGRATDELERAAELCLIARWSTGDAQRPHCALPDAGPVRKLGERTNPRCGVRIGKGRDTPGGQGGRCEDEFDTAKCAHGVGAMEILPSMTGLRSFSAQSYTMRRSSPVTL